VFSGRLSGRLEERELAARELITESPGTLFRRLQLELLGKERPRSLQVLCGRRTPTVARASMSDSYPAAGAANGRRCGDEDGDDFTDSAAQVLCAGTGKRCFSRGVGMKRTTPRSAETRDRE
jgi:hypothetical protein